jgi:hypothetical protein
MRKTLIKTRVWSIREYTKLAVLNLDDRQYLLQVLMHQKGAESGQELENVQQPKDQCATTGLTLRAVVICAGR